MRFRHGYYAIWRGTEYEASPDGSQVRLYRTSPADGFTSVMPDRHVRVVPAADVERLLYVNTVCTWRGERFVVLGEHDGWLRVEYTGGKVPVAERLGLEMYDRGVYQTWAPPHRGAGHARGGRVSRARTGVTGSGTWPSSTSTRIWVRVSGAGSSGTTTRCWG